MKVTEFASYMSTTPDTVRYYTRIGLLTPNKSAANGYKVFGKLEITRLKFILSARQLGFSVEDITDILTQADKGHSACPMVRDIVEQRLVATEKQFQEAMRLRERLKKAISDWQDKPNNEPTSKMICHLIEGEDDE
ncbi:MerR family transcriptional regulator [Colwellia sp. 12G3]|uniref:MerR family transcriptional regulator n=1 Tax=Colwellia sp. 12G3 TaxID=2058299 RepID=UPI000C3249FA|nr:MerR family DNA-binding protein [Colwellia sp. 12G3]PKI18155.1 MerR family transcriptional regulator [Colwellia sp. 12G3]